MDTTAAPRTERDKRSLVRTFFPSRLIHWFGVVLALAGAGAVGGIAVASLGLVNLSAIPPHPDGWARLLHFGMKRSVAAHAASSHASEPLDSSAMVTLGATQYALVCSHCHGAPGYGQSPIALSMRPEPPLLVDVSKSYSDAELFFIVQNGVRYTGMPAWSVANRPDEVWALVAFLKAMPGMGRQKYTQLVFGSSVDDRRTADLGTGNSATTLDGRSAAAIAPFVASTRDRPYLPGDPQSPYASPDATSSPRSAFADVGSGGGEPAATCGTCHGTDGSGRPGGAFPNLTLQSPQYLYDALRAFASGQRQSGIMWPIAASLSDDQMRAVAIRYGARGAVASERGADAVAPDALARGASLDSEGVSADARSASAKVERCSSCHIPGAYQGEIVPRLAGQEAAYVRMQLRLFKSGGRGDTSPYDPMVPDSHNVSEADIVALAAYYASLPPMTKK